MKKQSILAKLIVLVCSSVMLLGSIASAAGISVEQDSASFLSSSGDIYEPNNDSEHAYPITVSSYDTPIKITGTIDQPREQDYYKVTFTQDGTATVTFPIYPNEQYTPVRFVMDLYYVEDDCYYPVDLDGVSTKLDIYAGDTYMVQIYSRGSDCSETITYPLTIKETCEDVNLQYKDSSYTLAWEMPVRYPTGSQVMINNELFTPSGNTCILHDNKITDPKTYNIKARMKSSTSGIYSDWVERAVKLQLYGDVDGNGEVNGADVTAIIQHLNGLYPLTQEQLTIADVNGDGEVTELDINIMRDYLLSLMDELPIGKVCVLYYNKPWQSPSSLTWHLYGDADLNGEVNGADLARLGQHLNGLDLLTEQQQIIADVNGDGKVTIDDVNLIQDYLLWTITEFPAGKTAIFI
jgi:hypothetical protein